MTTFIIATLIASGLALIIKSRNDAPWADMREAHAHHINQNARIVQAELLRR